MHVVLVHPEIAPNTGNIIRLCANTGCALHLIEPLGFALDAARLKRGGLDYHELATVTTHTSLDALRQELPGRWFAFSARGPTRYDQVAFEPDDVLVFGAERAGLPESTLARWEEQRVLSLPMRPHNRSLNLANAVSIVVYEAWRQQGFDGAATAPDVSGTLTSETPGAAGFDR